MSCPEVEPDAPTVVLVDDDLFGLNRLDNLISGIAGSRIMCFSDGGEALAWCRANDPDVLITDYQLPGMSGMELLRKLRQEQRTRDIPILMITAVGDQAVRQEALELGANDFLNKPIDAPEVRARTKNMLAIRRGQRALRQRSRLLEQEVARATAKISDREQEIIVRLSRAAEYRDLETGAHIIRVAAFSRIIARHLDRPEDEQDLIFKAAPMHEVGKIGVPDEILLKAGRLDEAEFTVMQQHTTIGHGILSGSTLPLLEFAAQLALTHHEWYDGKGYPTGLTGEDIPLAGRIVAVADVFDALTSRRPYKREWAVDLALAHLREQAGAHFDPRCIGAFEAGLAEILIIRARTPDPAPPESQ